MLPGPTLYLLLLLLLAEAQPMHAQRSYGDQYDMPLRDCGLTDTPHYIPPYYSLGVKYPLSSRALVTRAGSEVSFPVGFTGSGCITVRFIVDVMGKTACFDVYTLDEQYHSTTFPQGITDSLVTFVKRLGKWPAKKYKDGKETPYYAFLTFRIKDGKVVHIIP